MTVRIQSEEEKITLKKYLTELAAQQAQAAENYERQAESSAAMAYAMKVQAASAIAGAQDLETNALAAQEMAARCRQTAEQCVRDLQELEAREAPEGKVSGQSTFRN